MIFRLLLFVNKWLNGIQPTYFPKISKKRKKTANVWTANVSLTTVASFNSAQWDGKFDSIVSHFETELGYFPYFILRPDFDLVLYKIRIVWDINILSSN